MYNLDSLIFVIIFAITGGLIVGKYIQIKSKGDKTIEVRNWRTQDWIWLVCFLLYAQIFTVLYKDMVMDVVSYVSTFVSTALGAVAIYISVREATKGDNVKDQINVMLGELREKINQMDSKIDKIDPALYEKIKKTEDKLIENLSDKLNNTVGLSKEEVNDIVKEQVKEVTSNLKASLNITNDSLNVTSFKEQQVYNFILKNYHDGNTFSVKTLYEQLKRSGISVSKDIVIIVIGDMILDGIIEETPDRNFFKIRNR
ncbi:hypothetical protein [Paenibacillus glycanilyticus]|uniref:hypothetical protein n=1 Tax=Paenibacillus glycanilyticus TaxID=126569 RepID=UPI000FD6E419|nr:hypothetical protein [Paenibacillus glycanilyticus]